MRTPVHRFAKETAFIKTTKHSPVTIQAQDLRIVQIVHLLKIKMIVARTKHARMEVAQTKAALLTGQLDNGVLATVDIKHEAVMIQIIAE